MNKQEVIRAIISQYKSTATDASYTVVWREYMTEGRGHWDVLEQDTFFTEDPLTIYLTRKNAKAAAKELNQYPALRLNA